MATFLPSTNSIVDYLNSRGMDSSQSARRKLYNQSGLSSRLGEYTYSANQNLALLDYMRSGAGAGSPSAPTATTQSPQHVYGGDVKNAFEPNNYGQSPTYTGSPRGGETISSPNGTYTNLPVYSTSGGDRFVTSGDASRYGSPNQSTLNYIRNTSSTPETNEKEGSGWLSGFMDKLFGEVYSYQKTDTGYKTSYEPSGVQKFFGKEGSSREVTTTPEPYSAETMANLEAQWAPKKTQTQAPTTTPTTAPTQTTPAQGNRANIQQRIDDIMAQIPGIQAGVAKLKAESDAKDAETKEQTGGFSASNITWEEPTTPSEQDLINDFLNTTEGRLLLEELQLNDATADAINERTKEELEKKYAAEKEQLEDDLAARGMAFSGVRASKVKDLSDSLASSLLDADRTFASKLLDADIRFRRDVIAGVADIMEAAQKDNDDAIKQLNLLGYAMVDGVLVPTLARENQTADNIRADANLAIVQRRLELAEEANVRAANEAAKGDPNLAQEFLVLMAAMQANPNSTPEDILLWGLQNTQLTEGQIELGISQAPIAPQVLEQDAITLVKSYYDKPSLWARLGSGDQRAEALVDARKAAIDAIRPGRTVTLQDPDDEDVEFDIVYTSQAQIDRLIATINSITYDDIK